MKEFNFDTFKMPRQPITVSIVNPWDIISDGIQDILACKQSSLSLSKLHNSVCNIISNSQGDLLRNGLDNLLRDHFSKWKDELSKRAGEVLILYFSNLVDNFKNYCIVIPKVYMLFDSNKVKGGPTIDIIRNAFMSTILKGNDQLIYDVTEEIKKTIYLIRTGKNNRYETIENIIEMFFTFNNDIDIFKNFFELLKNETIKFYGEFFRSKFEGNSFTAYLKIANEQFAKEENLLKSLFDKKTDEINIILKIVFNELFISQEPRFLSAKDPLISLALTGNDKIDLNWLVNTYKRFDFELENVYKSCADYIYDEISNLSLNFNENLKAKEIGGFIKEVIDLINRLSIVYNSVFEDVSKAIKYGNERIKNGWNISNFNISENFCVYIDLMIKGQLKDLPEEEKEKFPHLVAKYYKLIIDKQLFQTSYETYLQLRFIKLRGKVYEIEKSIILEIRKSGIQSFAQNLDSFKKQIDDMEDLMDNFYSSSKNDGKAKIKFEPIIFDDSLITLNKKVAQYIPEPLNQINQEFSSFYSKRYEHFKISLLSLHSFVESKIKITKGTQSKIFTINSDITCAAILLQISTGPKKYKELVSAIGIKEIIQHLKRVCSKSCPILKRDSVKKEVSDDDVFSFNPKIFSSKSRVITIPPINNERKANNKDIYMRAQDYKIDAIKGAAVCILKRKITLKETQLKSEIVEALSQYFRVDSKMIDKCLEKLEGEYLERKTQEDGTITVKYVS